MTNHHLMKMLLSYSDFINPLEQLNIYQYGSRVYESISDSSDYDFIMVGNHSESKREFTNSEISCTIYNVEEFKKLIAEHEISVLECLFLSESNILKQKVSFDFSLELPKLRKSIAKKASHSFVKAKKKLTIKEDYNQYVGLKSLFHSFRIIIFAIQIAEYGKIVDYTAANDYFVSIFSDPTLDWEYLKDKYKPMHNKLMSNFRKLAPKE